MITRLSFCRTRRPLSFTALPLNDHLYSSPVPVMLHASSMSDPFSTMLLTAAALFVGNAVVIVCVYVQEMYSREGEHAMAGYPYVKHCTLHIPHNTCTYHNAGNRIPILACVNASIWGGVSCTRFQVIYFTIQYTQEHKLLELLGNGRILSIWHSMKPWELIH